MNALEMGIIIAKRTRLFAAVMVGWIVFLGCATPQAALNPDVNTEDIQKYKIVYLLVPDTEDQDPRKVYPRVAERLEKMGFTVNTVSKENPIKGAQGTGFVISENGYILTCEHIFADEQKASVWLKGNRYLADVVKVDKEHDLALLKIDETQDFSSKPLTFSTDPAYQMGQSVYTIGFPLSQILGNSPRLTRGFVSSTVGLKDDPNFLQISVEIQPGNSGSPLLDENGTVLGIIQGTLNAMSVLARTGGSLPQNVNFAAKNKIIQDFLMADRKSSAETPIRPIPSTAGSRGFDEVLDSVVQIRAGDVSEAFLQQPKLFCNVIYQSFWDFWYRFRVFHIEFYDMESGELLLKAGQYGDNALSTENKVLDKTFEQIQSHFSSE